MDLLFNRYKIEKLLGRGSAGQVYLCQDTLIGNLKVAVKVLPKWILDQPKQRARIASEMLILRSIKSPYIVDCYDFHHDQEHSAIVLEYVKGETLRALLDSKKELSVEKKFALARDLLTGLSHIHDQGLVHRDIKPENIIIPPEGKLRIIDFGLITSKGTDKDVPLIRNTEQSDSVVGTLYYLAPEMLDGGIISQRTDAYAATMIIFEILTGAELFEDGGIVRLFLKKSNGEFENAYRSLSSEMQWLIAKGTSPKPEDRFENAQKMLAEFQNVAVNSGVFHQEDFLSLSDQPIKSGVLSTPSSQAISMAAYQSAKVVQFSFHRFLRSRKKESAPSSVGIGWPIVAVLLLVGVVLGFGVPALAPASGEKIHSFIQEYLGGEYRAGVGEQAVPSGYRLIDKDGQ